MECAHCVVLQAKVLTLQTQNSTHEHTISQLKYAIREFIKKTEELNKLTNLTSPINTNHSKRTQSDEIIHLETQHMEYGIVLPKIDYDKTTFSKLDNKKVTAKTLTPHSKPGALKRKMPFDTAKSTLEQRGPPTKTNAEQPNGTPLSHNNPIIKQPHGTASPPFKKIMEQPDGSVFPLSPTEMILEEPHGTALRPIRKIIDDHHVLPTKSMTEPRPLNDHNRRIIERPLLFNDVHTTTSNRLRLNPDKFRTRNYSFLL
jgi:hypothetical protein